MQEKQSQPFYSSGIADTRSRSHEVLRGKQNRLSEPEKEIFGSKILRDPSKMKL